jgi:hypothetical protein
VPHRTAIKWLFAVVVLSQPLQYLLVSKFGEPYPALMMPQFAGTLTDANGNIRTRTVEARVLFEDNSTESVSINKLLFPAPVSHQDAILEYVFGVPTQSNSRPPSSTSLSQRIKSTLFPGLVVKYAKYARRSQENADPQTIVWLRKRLQDLYPSRNAKTVIFTWYQDSYLPGSPLSERSRRTMGTYAVHLETAQ